MKRVRRKKPPGVMVRILSPYPRERIRAVIEFTEQDLAVMTPAENAAIAEAVWMLAGMPRRRVAEADLKEIQTQVRTALKDLASGLGYHLSEATGGWELQRVEDDSRAEKRKKRPKAAARSPAKIITRYSGPPAQALILRLVEWLNLVGVEHLEPCPLQEPGGSERCGRLFLGERRQRFCSLAHSRRQAWLDWNSRQQRRTANKRLTNSSPQAGTRRTPPPRKRA